MKASGAYEKYVDIHDNVQDANFHQTPWFLPWHREFIRWYEAAIQQAIGDPTFGLPYWDCVHDWANAQSSPLAVNAAVWGNDYMGNTIGPAPFNVTSGPFVNWPTTNPAGLLERNFGNPLSDQPSLPTQAALNEVMATFTTSSTSGWADRCLR